MLSGLAAEMEHLDIPIEGEAISDVIALYDRLAARIAAAAGAFEAHRISVDATMPMTAWLRANGGMTRRAASRLWSQAARLRRLPVTAAAYADGVLSAGQIEAIVIILDDELTDTFAAQESELVPSLAPLTVAGVARAMSAWKLRAHPEPTEPHEPDRAVYLSNTLDDRYVLDGALDPEGGAVVATALRLATPETFDGRNSAQRRGDALVEVCRFFLDHQRTRPGRRHRPHRDVVGELDDLEAGRVDGWSTARSSTAPGGRR